MSKLRITQPTATAKVETLIEALPWMTHYADSIIVLIFGGNALVDVELF